MGLRMKRLLVEAPSDGAGYDVFVVELRGQELIARDSTEVPRIEANDGEQADAARAAIRSARDGLFTRKGGGRAGETGKGRASDASILCDPKDCGRVDTAQVEGLEEAP